MSEFVSRRHFLSRGISGLSAVWAATHWPAVLAAAEHAHSAASSPLPPKFEFFTPEEAKEIDAIAARIIPSDDLPGAREAGTVYFIDRGLTTFATDDQKTYREGLPEFQARVAEMLSGVSKFSALNADQQDELLHSFDDSSQQGQRQRRFRSRPGAGNFFETLRQHTIVAFLIDPYYGGNHDGVGWKVIGREHEHMFQAPFGYYDKDYPGWEQAMKEAEKK
jgi:gluconate 2-dehydrogenase gamma chain